MKIYDYVYNKDGSIKTIYEHSKAWIPEPPACLTEPLKPPEDRIDTNSLFEVYLMDKFSNWRRRRKIRRLQRELDWIKFCENMPFNPFI